jgi:thymidylate kinase
MSPIIIIEGLDRLGKSTLINNILDEYGFYHYIHYEKPKKLAVYQRTSINPLYAYQNESFDAGFRLIENAAASATPSKIIFDRFHLGEYVYSPLYRGYAGEYVFEQEKRCLKYVGGKTDLIKMILLTSSNFEFMEDDGLSFDPTNKEKEQNLFIEAFNKSAIHDKRIIDVHNGNGGFKNPRDIFIEATK